MNWDHQNLPSSQLFGMRFKDFEDVEADELLYFQTRITKSDKLNLSFYTWTAEPPITSLSCVQSDHLENQERSHNWHNKNEDLVAEADQKYDINIQNLTFNNPELNDIDANDFKSFSGSITELDFGETNYWLATKSTRENFQNTFLDKENHNLEPKKADKLFIIEKVYRPKLRLLGCTERARNTKTRKSDIEKPLNSSRSKDLSNRSDVVNKALIRMIRKFLKYKYKESLKFKLKRASLSKLKQYEKSIMPWINILVEQSQSNILGRFDSEVINELIGRVINSSWFSKMQKNNESKSSLDLKKFVNDFHDCCSLYSHSKFRALKSSKYFIVLYEIFVKNINDSFFDSQNLLKEKEKYSGMFEKIQLTL